MRSICVTAAVLLAPAAAFAFPVAPAEFCVVYPEAPVCAGSGPDCALCHTIPPTRNVYGASISAALLPGTPRPLSSDDFVAGLEAALTSVETLDADGDGASNLDEILAGTLPADAASVPATGDCPTPAQQLGWDPCGPDLPYTFKKLTLDACGRSPTRDERAAFEAATDREAYLVEVLDRCLDSEFWRAKDGVLWNLANRKIRPTQSIKSGDGAGDIPLADYYDDYNFFVYTQTDDRDARDLLTATYQVSRTDGPTTSYTPYTRSPIEDVIARGFDVAQAVEIDRRAGMLTMRWFLMSNTMFTALPRTTAAQAYRAFLGYDIARLEGLYDVAGEPADFDNKGVQAPECARCHSTLDPLTYPFAYYSGIGGERPGTLPYSYIDDRPERFTYVDGDRVADTPEAGALFGQPVQDLLQWARVAADSDAFARATVLDYWRLFMGDDPTPSQQAEFTRLWQDFKTTHQYRVERMLHALVRTEAYRVP